MRGFGASGRSSSRIKDQARPALSALCSSIRSWSIVNRTSAPPTSPCWIVKSFLLGIAMRVQPREEPNHLGREGQRHHRRWQRASSLATAIPYPGKGASCSRDRSHG